VLVAEYPFPPLVRARRAQSLPGQSLRHEWTFLPQRGDPAVPLLGLHRGLRCRVCLRLNAGGRRGRPRSVSDDCLQSLGCGRPAKSLLPVGRGSEPLLGLGQGGPDSPGAGGWQADRERLPPSHPQPGEPRHRGAGARIRCCVVARVQNPRGAGSLLRGNRHREGRGLTRSRGDAEESRRSKGDRSRRRLR